MTGKNVLNGCFWNIWCVLASTWKLWAVAFMYNRGGEPNYYHGPHELCIIASAPQSQLNLSYKILSLSNYEEEWLSWLTV